PRRPARRRRLPPGAPRRRRRRPGRAAAGERHRPSATGRRRGLPARAGRLAAVVGADPRLSDHTMGPIYYQQHADPWSTNLLDVESLNAHVTDAVLAAIDAVRGQAGRESGVRTSRSFLALGPAGAGKTHLFARLRRRTGARAAFVLIRPELAVEPSPRLLLAQAVDALRRPVPNHPDRSQLDVTVGSAVSILRGAGARWPAVALDQLRAASDADRRAALDQVVDLVEAAHPEVDPDWLGRLLELPFASGPDRRAALQWLSGREPDVAQLERLGLREPLPESSVLPALRTLAVVASFGAPLVIVFDQ